MDGILNAPTPLSIIEPGDYSPNVKAYRYFFPIVFEFELDGFLEVRHFKTDGTSIDSAFSNQSKSIQVGSTVPITPATNANYTYVGYKKSVTSSPSGGSILTGNPPTFTYDGTYDTYYLNLYYEETGNGGGQSKFIVKHYKKDGSSLSSMFPDKIENLTVGSTYSAAPAAHAQYTYYGHKSSKTTDPPSGSIVSGNPSPMNFVYNGSFPAYTVYLYYDEKPISSSDGVIKVRHMVKTSPSGSYTNAREENVIVSPLPGTKKVSADAALGTILGSNLSYTSYVDGSYTTGSTNETASLTSTKKAAYVTFFYQKTTVSIIGDFDIIKDKINYREPFKLHPKNIVVTGCSYQYHYFEISRDGITSETPRIYGSTTDFNFTESNYPYSLGIGMHDVRMKIVAECGESDWIGPKPLEVLGPVGNSPPQFKIGYVHPYEGLRTIPVYEVVVGTTMDLIYIDDPSVPTPFDPDGDVMYFEYFDFSESSEWAKQIPSKYQNSKYTDGYHGVLMDTLGNHPVKAKMRDKFGATSTATTYINVVPENPVPIIDASNEVTEGRPLKIPLNSSRSYSPMKREINHSRDEWTNRKNVYDTVGTETVTLSVYDSAGLKSLAPATHIINVKPDLPPIPQLEFTTPSIRNVEMVFKERSYSPDQDVIEVKDFSYRYDSDNDGDFDDETMIPIELDSNRNFKLTPNRVGIYEFHIYLKEDWGKEAQQSWIFEVVNDSPTVSFDISTESKEPIVIPSIPLYASNMVNLEGWKNYDLGGERTKSWGANPVTGALAHSPEHIRGNNYLDVIGPSHDYKPRVILPGGYSYNGANVYFKDGYNIVFEDAMQYETLRSAKYWLYKQADPPATGQASIWGGGNYRINERVTGYDAINDLVYVSRKTGIKDGYDFYEPFVYTWENFITWTGVTGTATKVNTVEYSASNSFSSAYGIMTTTNGTGGKYNLVTGDWASGAVIGTSQTVDSRVGSLISKAPDASMTYHGYLTNPAPHPSGYYKFDSKSYTLSSVPNIPSGVYTPTRDGKFTISDTGNVYSTATGLLTGEMLGSKRVTLMFKDVVVMTDNIKLTAYRISSSGVPSQVWTMPVVATGNIPDMTKADAAGYAYYISNKKVFKIKIETGAISQLHDLTTMWRDSSSGSSVNRWISVGDGQLVYSQTVYCTYSDGSSCGRSTSSVIITSGIDYSNVKLVTQQQLLNSKDFTNIQLNFKIRFNEYPYSTAGRYSGYSFHAQDNRNMYRVEMNVKGIRLVKVVNGVRSVLSEAAYPINKKTFYPVKVQVLDGQIKAYINGVPLIDIRDETYDKGLFGPYSEIPWTEFTNMAYSDLTPISSSAKLQGIAIVGQPMIYSILNQDTENDPMIVEKTNWRYDQLSQKFLDAGDGKSGVSIHDGKTYRDPKMVMDKVGLYQVNYDTMDDPNPDYLHPAAQFDPYRKDSNRAARQLIVHRAPIADYDLGFNPDYTIKWTDRSRDLDRYLSATNYSTEATGIDYLATKGVLQKKFYYITPSGLTVEQKLVTPEEKGGYTVGLAVKDEYDAWSPFLEKKINVTMIPQPDDPPKAGFTLSHKKTYRNVEVTINSTASDKEDGSRENLPHQYYMRNLTAGGYETLQSSARTSWKKTFNTMGTFQIRQVVEDKLGQSDQAIDTIEIVNRIPIAQVTYPSSADQLKPEKVTVVRPAFLWMYTDGDGDAMKKYQVRVYRYGGILEQESGVVNGSALTWEVLEDLPEMVNLFVMVRAYDGYDWSEWSNPKFFYIETNQPPTADFDWSPKPVYEGDMIQLTQLIDDPDLDPLNVQYRITSPAGEVQTDSKTSNAPYRTEGPSFKGVKTGIYQVELTVSDGKAPAVVVHKDIRVLPLTVAGQIKHTDLWNERRKEYNLKSSGNEESPRGYDVYWAGERFMLAAQTTATGTATKALRVEVAMGGFSVELTDSEAGALNWTGDLWDESFEQLPDGEITFIFTAVYSNGTVKSVPVTVSVAANVNSTFGVHRRQ
ncbi:hypothetical protein NNL21_13330 [Paenibacillus mendelii]|nr:hypothetical protein [Paenibacillus mendelii]